MNIEERIISYLYKCLKSENDREVRMELQALYKLEVEGISKTIRSYTVENYIKSYSKQLLELSIDEDIDVITVIIERLTDWYASNISDIEDSKFVTNKDEHNKSYHVLLELNRKLHENKRTI